MTPNAVSASTWENLVQLEPDLQTLLLRIRCVRSTHGFCANDVWYGQRQYPVGIRQVMSLMVGWLRKSGPELLRTKESYDLAYRTLYYALPDCRHEGIC